MGVWREREREREGKYRGNVLSDLVGALSAEKIEVAKKVVVEGEELKVELREGEDPGSVVVCGRDFVLVPQEALGGVQRELLHLLLLRDALAVVVDEHLHKESGVL